MKLSKVFSFTAIGIISNALLMAVSFIFIRSSSIEESGTFFYYVTLSSMIVNFALLGNATYLNKAFIDKNYRGALKILPNVRVFFFLMFLFGSLISGIIHDKLNSLIFAAVFIEVGLIKSYRERVYCSFMRAHGTGQKYLQVQGAYVISRLLITIAYGLSIIDFEMLILAYLICSLMTIYQTRNIILEIFFSTEPRSFRSYVLNGLPYFLATLFTMGYDYAPVIALKMVANDIQAIGIFSATYKITSILVLSLGILSQSLLPYLRAIYNKRGKKKTIRNGIFILTVILAMYAPVFFILDIYSYELINISLGEKYTLGKAAFQYQIYGVWGSIVNFITFSILQAIDKQNKIIAIVAPSAICNVILAILFSSEGALGVSKALCYSLFMCAFVSILVVFTQLRRCDEQ